MTQVDATEIEAEITPEEEGAVATLQEEIINGRAGAVDAAINVLRLTWLTSIADGRSLSEMALDDPGHMDGTFTTINQGDDLAPLHIVKLTGPDGKEYAVRLDTIAPPEEGASVRIWVHEAKVYGWATLKQPSALVIPGEDARKEPVVDKVVEYTPPFFSVAEQIYHAALMDMRSRAQYDLRPDDIDQRIAALPEPMRDRIAAFHEADPRFRLDGEIRELRLCEEAANLADRAKEATTTLSDEEERLVRANWGASDIDKTDWVNDSLTAQWLVWATHPDRAVELLGEGPVSLGPQDLPACVALALCLVGGEECWDDIRSVA